MFTHAGNFFRRKYRNDQNPKILAHQICTVKGCQETHQKSANPLKNETWRSFTPNFLHFIWKKQGKSFGCFWQTTAADMPSTGPSGHSETKRKLKINDLLKKAPGLGSGGSLRSPVGLRTRRLSVSWCRETTCSAERGAGGVGRRAGVGGTGGSGSSGTLPVGW